MANANWEHAHLYMDDAGTVVARSDLSSQDVTLGGGGGSSDWWLTTATGPVHLQEGSYLDVVGPEVPTGQRLALFASFAGASLTVGPDGDLRQANEADDTLFVLSATGAVTISPSDAAVIPLTTTAATGGAVFSITGKPTGVAVTAGAIHAALVTLGLIAA